MQKILIIEDERVQREMLSRRLSRRGYEIVVAEDGAKGIELAIRELPDLILMDLGLPIIGGWEATRQIKSATETNDIPIIALTSYSRPSDRERALVAGCNDYFTKPVELKKLIGKIESFLGEDED